MDVYVVSYDWSDYGQGVDAVFETLEAAQEHVLSDENWHGTPKLRYTDDENQWQYTDEDEEDWYLITRTQIKKAGSS